MGLNSMGNRQGQRVAEIIFVVWPTHRLRGEKGRLDGWDLSTLPAAADLRELL